MRHITYRRNPEQDKVAKSFSPACKIFAEALRNATKAATVHVQNTLMSRRIQDRNINVISLGTGDFSAAMGELKTLQSELPNPHHLRYFAIDIKKGFKVPAGLYALQKSNAIQKAFLLWRTITHPSHSTAHEKKCAPLLAFIARHILAVLPVLIQANAADLQTVLDKLNGELNTDSSSIHIIQRHPGGHRKNQERMQEMFSMIENAMPYLTDPSRPVRTVWMQTYYMNREAMPFLNALAPYIATGGMIRVNRHALQHKGKPPLMGTVSVLENGIFRTEERPSDGFAAITTLPALKSDILEKAERLIQKRVIELTRDGWLVYPKNRPQMLWSDYLINYAKIARRVKEQGGAATSIPSP